MTFSKDVSNLYVRHRLIARVYSERTLDICQISLNCEEAEELRKWLGQIIAQPTLETPAVLTWRCSICNTVNPDDVTHCRQCEYSRMILRDGREVPRDGYR